MSKKISIAIIIILLIITTFFMVLVWKEKTMPVANQNNAISQEQPIVLTEANNETKKEGISSDKEISEIESDMNSVSDDNFSENTLSDQEVGL